MKESPPSLCKKKNRGSAERRIAGEEHPDSGQKKSEIGTKKSVFGLRFGVFGTQNVVFGTTNFSGFLRNLFKVITGMSTTRTLIYRMLYSRSKQHVYELLVCFRRQENRRISENRIYNNSNALICSEAIYQSVIYNIYIIYNRLIYKNFTYISLHDAHTLFSEILRFFFSGGYCFL